LCAARDTLCDIWALPYEPFREALAGAEVKQVPALYTFALSWLAWIQAHSDDYSALAKLPQVQAALQRVQALDERYEEARIAHFLAVLNTIRPPALGGDFEAGRAYYERALEVSRGLDLGIKVDYARYYARTLYDRELHDRLLLEVLATDPEQSGLTLFNTLAQEEARELLAGADDYF
jgi:CRP-like cAMP-binding protein